MYPDACRLDLTEDLFGHPVADPYRWLEDSGSPEAAAWLAAQGRLWAGWRQDLPQRDAFARRVGELLRVGWISPPTWRGRARFYTRRDPGQEHGVLHVADGEASRVLIDPVALDPSGRTTLDHWQPDKEGRLLAYQLSAGGTEESLLSVMDVTTGTLIDGPIDRCRYSGVAWLPGGKAFYYVRRLPPGAVPDGEQQYHRRVYLHTVGTDPEADTLIFGEGRDKTTYYGVSVSRDGRWLVISASIGTAPRDDTWIADLSGGDPARPQLTEVTAGLDAQSWLHPGRDGRLYVLTDLDAPRTRLAIADPASPGPESWHDLIPQDPEAVLRGYAILDLPGGRPPGTPDAAALGGLSRPAPAGGVLLARWTRHAVSEVTVHDLATGERLAALDLPGIGSAGGIAERPEGGHEAWFTYTDYTTPPVVLRYDATTGALDTYATAPGQGELAAGEPGPARGDAELASPELAIASAGNQVTAAQRTYAGKDGTPVRMVVIRPAGATGPLPTILYGYGGFNISMTPGYSAAILAWVQAGGAYAIAGLRGGSEEGEDWHRAGMLDRKQNVFDDFHAAAEDLIGAGLTTPGQLAVWGGSNGGLLVGAAVTQRPDLFAACVCSAPLLDMVRYEKFGLGETWNTEYGSAAVPGELEWLLSYSPYHRVTAGTAYPSVLFTVFANDTRVDPMHAYKMCAALQHATSSGRPVLLRAEGQVGHGARAVSLSAALSGDTLAFVARETGLGSAGDLPYFPVKQGGRSASAQLLMP
ncbi:MAG TPA: prolyl oligopeptidase family serine peptidase [Trebonia sp.]|nr:prolyl oligopeptidase family serine peptidase [Trebonia sp.]